MYDRPKHRFSARDVERILNSWLENVAEDPPDAGGAIVHTIIETLRRLSLRMLGVILWFLDESTVRKLYDLSIEWLDRIFGVRPADETHTEAKRLIWVIAARSGLTVVIKD